MSLQFADVPFISELVYNITLTSLSLSTMCYRPYYNRVSKLPSILGKVIFIKKKKKKAQELISVALMFTFKSSSGALFLLPAPVIA